MKCFEDFEKTAIDLDTKDPLRSLRSKFYLPTHSETIYFCNNSLGLPALDVFPMMQNLLQEWSEMGVEGWFNGKSNWYGSLDASFNGALSHLLGSEDNEVAVMNSLTVNLHLLFVSFYQPTKSRSKILIEWPAFPSDLYAVKSHIRSHGLHPESELIIVKPRLGEHLLRNEDIREVIMQQGESIALVFLSAVNFLTGQVLDIESIAHLAKQKGCVMGCDLAHAAGNIPLKLHEWNVDFAMGCSYKYLCSGPGGPGIVFVHSSHHQEQLPRLTGWWGNDPKLRFQMQLEEEFYPYGGASSWAVSTPSIIAMTPLLASLKIFKEAGISNIRKKSELQTAFLLELLEQVNLSAFDVITPRGPSERGSQISLLIHDNAEYFLKALERNRVVCDYRAPNIIRVTPSPLYNTFHEIYRFVNCMRSTFS